MMPLNSSAGLASKKKALRSVTTEGEQTLGLVAELDSLGNQCEAKRFGQPRDGIDDGAIVGIRRDTGDKTLIDLQGGNR